MGQLIQKTDSQLQDDVLRELRWDTRVKATEIGVEVTESVVTLTGTVDSWPARVAAQEAAHRVLGVHDVANEIHVKLPTSSERTDTDLARVVRGALEWDVLVPDQRITTTVSGGAVTLEGRVDFWSEHDDAARAIRNLPGVREIRNLIAVEPHPPKVEPETLRIAIDSALARHYEHAARHIQIAVSEGTVILSGRVPSWPEHDAVLGAVRGTRGVQKVDDNIAIG